MGQETPTILEQVNEKLKASLTGVESLSAAVDVIFDGFEELKDGFQVGDVLSLIGSVTNVYLKKDLVVVEALDLQDEEIAELVARGDNFSLGKLATEAKQLVKWILVTIQTADVFFFENN